MEVGKLHDYANMRDVQVFDLTTALRAVIEAHDAFVSYPEKRGSGELVMRDRMALKVDEARALLDRLSGNP